MKRIGLAFLIACLSCTAADARPHHWYTRVAFYAGEAVIIGATYSNARATCAGYRHGFTEGNLLANGTTSCASAVSILAVGAGIYTGLNIWSHTTIDDSDSRKWKFLRDWTVPAIACAVHCTAAVREFNQVHAR
jgi:hypothetical protein